jgi:hypothetical protein
MVNCVIIDKQTTPSGVTVRCDGYASILNCTIVRDSGLTGTTTGINETTGATPLIKNTAVFGFTTAVATGTYDAASDYNASDDTTTPGSNSLDSLTYASQFQDTAGSDCDFRALSSGSLDGAGTRDQTNTNDLDIIGQSRSTTAPTIGAWEVVTSGGDAQAALGGSAITGGHGTQYPVFEIAL